MPKTESMGEGKPPTGPRERPCKSGKGSMQHLVQNNCPHFWEQDLYCQ